MKAKLILCDGTQKTIEIKTIAQARELICSEGYNSPIEMINLSNHRIIIMDEEGKLKRLPMNSEATRLAHEEECIFPSDYICGDVILIDDFDDFDALAYE